MLFLFVTELSASKPVDVFVTSHYTEDGQVDCNGSDVGVAVATSSDPAVL